MPKGLFITLEGGEGAGKSTLARNLADHCRARGRTVVTTREPGGAPGADEIRKLLVEGGAERWSSLEEALLFSAARLNHLDHLVRPALKDGAVVISDRYYDLTRAYQIAAGGVSADVLDKLNALISAPAPDRTLILDLDPALGLARLQGKHIGEDRFERKNADFHARVRAAFLDIAKSESERCAVIDASAPPEVVFAAARAAIEPLL